MAEKRLFIAVPLNQDYRLVINDFKETQDQDFRWIPEKNWHLTLLFLGDFPETKTEQLRNHLEDFFCKQPPLAISPKDFILAPKLTKARMVWLRFAESTAFDQLVNSLFYTLKAFYEEAGLPFNISLHKRQIPHLTLARFKPFNAYNKVFLKGKNLIESLPALRINQAVLYESILKPEGAEYYDLNHFYFHSQG